MHSPHGATASLTRLVLWPINLFRRGVRLGLSTLEILLAALGAVAALVVTALLTPALNQLPGAAGDFAPIGVAILLAPIGIGVALGRRAEVERFVNTVRGRAETVALTGPPAPSEVILDTSAIIDGRIADVASSGFILAKIVVPRFVLEELRRVADSSDSLRRGRGRAGLELLSRLQGDETVSTEIVDDGSSEADGDVDARLVRMAVERGAALALTDANLARVAELEGVRTLNLNVLANAVKTNVLPGEPLTVEVIERGRGEGQGVGYLADGTMVVVEEGADVIGQMRSLVVKRVIQTQAGRMVFAQLAAEAEIEQG